MLIRKHDAAHSDDEWRSFLDAQGFGHLVAGGGPDRAIPIVVPTQFIVHDDHDESSVVLHLAKANPIFDALAESPAVVLSVAGDWAYIPTSIKALPSESPDDFVPTTYYAAVQIEGEIEIIDDPAALADVLRTQLGGLHPDGFTDPTNHAKLLPAIRGLRLPITSVRAKFKYGGNTDVAHQEYAASELAARQGPGDAAALGHLRRRLGAQNESAAMTSAPGAESAPG